MTTLSAGASVVQAGEGRRLLANVSFLAGSQAATWSLAMAWTLIVPRFLGPTQMGLTVMGTSVSGVFGIVLGLGTKNYLVRELVLTPGETSQLIGTAMVLRLLLLPAFIASVIGYTYASHLGADASVVLYLSAGTTFVGLFVEPIQAGFQAIEQMEYLAYSSVITAVVGTAGAILLAVTGFAARGVAGAAFAVSLLTIILNMWWSRSRLGIAWSTNLHRLGRLVKESVSFWVFGVFFMVYLWIDSLMLSLLTPSEVVGWYGVATKIFTTLMFLPTILATAWLPKLVASFRSGFDGLRRASRVPLELVMLLSLPICVEMAMTANPVVHLLFGSGYRSAEPVTAILALCVPPMYLNILLNQILVAAKRQAVWTWVMALATVVNPLLNLGLIQLTSHRYHNGAIGAALSLVLTEVIVVGAGIILVGRKVVLSSSAWKFGRGLLAAAAMAGVMQVTKPLGFVVAAAAGLLTFGTAALGLRVSSIAEIRGAVSGVLAWIRARRSLPPAMQADLD